jgi:cation transport regulator
MPYAANEDLPPAVQGHLPAHAQDIFREAFNNAWQSCGESRPQRREEIAFRVGGSSLLHSSRGILQRKYNLTYIDHVVYVSRIKTCKNNDI